MLSATTEAMCKQTSRACKLACVPPSCNNRCTRFDAWLECLLTTRQQLLELLPISPPLVLARLAMLDGCERQLVSSSHDRREACKRVQSWPNTRDPMVADERGACHMYNSLMRLGLEHCAEPTHSDKMTPDKHTLPPYTPRQRPEQRDKGCPNTVQQTLVGVELCRLVSLAPHVSCSCLLLALLVAGGVRSWVMQGLPYPCSHSSNCHAHPALKH